jgi:hypothetical protein
LFTTVENDPNIVHPGILGFEDTSYVSFNFDDYPDEVFNHAEEQVEPQRKFRRSRSLNDIMDDLVAPKDVSAPRCVKCLEQSSGPNWGSLEARSFELK